MRNKLSMTLCSASASAAVLLLLTWIGCTDAACPNKCGGHGRCGKNDVCECMQNWQGGDCSLRICPFVRAWHDTAMATDDAHYYQECGNRGSCDRDKGLCECDVGFGGSGCRRLSCPGDCSGHGTCEFIEDLAADGFDRRVGGAFGRKYTLWDQEKIMGCRCDPMFEGHDCSKRVCPRGDDPLTTGQVNMVQAVIVSGNTAAVEGYLTYHDPYGMAWNTDRISFGLTAASCDAVEIALNRLPNNVLNSVVVTSAAVTPFARKALTPDSGVVWDLMEMTTPATETTPTSGNPFFSDPTTPTLICVVSFQSEPGTTGLQNLLGCTVEAHADALGQHPMTIGTGIAATASSKCTVVEIYPEGPAELAASTIAVGGSRTRVLTELAECANRGQCDATTGTCKCYTGHMGLSCQKQEALV